MSFQFSPVPLRRLVRALNRSACVVVVKR